MKNEGQNQQLGMELKMTGPIKVTKTIHGEKNSLIQNGTVTTGY